MIRRLDLTIAERLAVGFAALLLLLGAAMAVIFHWQGRSSAAQARYAERIAPLADAVDDLERGVINLAVQLRRQLLFPDGSRLPHFHAAQAEIAQLLQRLSQLPMDSGEEALYAEARPRVERYQQRAERLVEIQYGGGGVPLEEEIAVSEEREATLQVLRRFRDLEDRRRATALAAMTTARARAATSLIVASALTLVLFLVLAAVVIRAVRRPVGELLDAAAALREGRWQPAQGLTHTLPERPRGEIAQLGRGLAAAANALHHRERRLAAEGRVVAATSSDLDRERLGRAALRELADFAGAEVGVIYWHEPDTAQLHPVAWYALAHPPAALRIGEGVPGQAAADRCTLVLNDIPPDTPFQVAIGYAAASPRSVVAVPIVLATELHGVLLIAALRQLDEDTVAFLERAAAHLGVALQNAHSYAEARRLLAEVRASHERIREQNEQLQVQNEELQSQAEELQAQAEQIQAQNEELRVQSDQLQGHVADLAAADSQKNQFIAMLAHELRNPLAAINNSLYVLRRGVTDGASTGTAIGVIGRQTAHLKRLVDDLLDATRIAQGKVELQLQRLDLVEVARSCVEDVRATLDRAGLDMVIDLPQQPVWVEGDHTRMCQVLGNLLTNAAKFTPRGGRVELTLRREGRRAVLRVRDTGIGIDGPLLEQLFEPFTQGAPGEGGNTGLGLGLSLVKGLVELHAGTVAAHSAGRGRGAEFLIELPLAPAPGADPAAAGRARGRGEGVGEGA